MSYNTPTTTLCAEVIDAAHKIAQSVQSPCLGTEHVLLGFLDVDDCPVRLALTNLGVTRESVGTILFGSGGEKCVTMGRLPMVPRLCSAFSRGMEIARKWDRETVGTSELALGLLQDPNCLATTILSQLVSLDELTQGILDLRLQLHFRSEVGVVGMEQAINTALQLGTASDLIASLRRSRERIDDAIVQLIRRS